MLRAVPDVGSGFTSRTAQGVEVQSHGCRLSPRPERFRGRCPVPLFKRAHEGLLRQVLPIVFPAKKEGESNETLVMKSE